MLFLVEAAVVVDVNTNCEKIEARRNNSYGMYKKLLSD